MDFQCTDRIQLKDLRIFCLQERGFWRNGIGGGGLWAALQMSDVKHHVTQS